MIEDHVGDDQFRPAIWSALVSSDSMMNATLQKLRNLRFMLIISITIMALLGFLLAIIVSELCRYGYIPDESEEASGWENPYKQAGAGCQNSPAKIYSIQSVVSFTTLVLCFIVPLYRWISHRELEKQLIFAVTYGEHVAGRSLDFVHERGRKQRQMYEAL